MGLIVPAGKRVTIKSGENVVVSDLLLEDAITINLSSNFSQLIDNEPNALLTMIGGLSREVAGFGFSGQFKQAGLQIWTGTQPMNLSITVGLYTETDALTDVVQPAKALMRLPLPIEGRGSFGLTPPGPSILEALSENTPSEPAEGKFLSMRIGKLIHMTRMLVKTAEPTLSQEVDENGYPIWIKMKLDIVSIFTATGRMVDDYFGR